MKSENVSTDKEAAQSFVVSFQKFMKEKNQSLDQIFNCDETNLLYCLLPEKTLAACLKKSADGRKKDKN